MEDQNLHYRHIILFYLKKGKNASQTCNKVGSLYGRDAFSLRLRQKMVWKYWSENLSVKDCQPTEIDTDKIEVIVDENPKKKNDKKDEKGQYITD